MHFDKLRAVLGYMNSSSACMPEMWSYLIFNQFSLEEFCLEPHLL